MLHNSRLLHLVNVTAAVFTGSSYLFVQRSRRAIYLKRLSSFLKPHDWKIYFGDLRAGNKIKAQTETKTDSKLNKTQKANQNTKRTQESASAMERTIPK